MIKLGIIGMSEGNGHPYSWSAIFNGYNSNEMKQCDFPVILDYLSKQTWPNDQIKNAKVTHIWTQDKSQSKRIAKASLIDNIVDNPVDMIGHVDAILLARDDAKNHLRFANEFLKAGLPIYIDKPIALSSADLDEIYNLEKFKGQIFTCSALRYAKEFIITPKAHKKLGEIRQIHAISPKSWDKYSVHIIEPVLKMLDQNDSVLSYQNDGLIYSSTNHSRGLSVLWKSGILTRFFTLSDAQSPLSITLYGTKSSLMLEFKDSFSAFKSALEDFILQVQEKSIRSPREFNTKVVSLIEAGRER